MSGVFADKVFYTEERCEITVNSFNTMGNLYNGLWNLVHCNTLTGIGNRFFENTRRMSYDC